MILNEDLIAKAKDLTGIEEKTALVHKALETLIALESAKRLALLGGSEPNLEEIPRRRIARA